MTTGIRVYSVLLGINLNYNNIFMISISHGDISNLYISLDIKRVNLCLNYISALEMRLIALINACENRLTHDSALNIQQVLSLFPSIYSIIIYRNILTVILPFLRCYLPDLTASPIPIILVYDSINLSNIV